MSDAQPLPFHRVAELEARQDEALRRLDELEKQIDAVLRQWTPKKAESRERRAESQAALAR
jgi:hypothetical protein